MVLTWYWWTTNSKRWAVILNCYLLLEQEGTLLLEQGGSLALNVCNDVIPSRGGIEEYYSYQDIERYLDWLETIKKVESKPKKKKPSKTIVKAAKKIKDVPRFSYSPEIKKVSEAQVQINVSLLKEEINSIRQELNKMKRKKKSDEEAILLLI